MLEVISISKRKDLPKEAQECHQLLTLNLTLATTCSTYQQKRQISLHRLFQLVVNLLKIKMQECPRVLLGLLAVASATKDQMHSTENLESSASLPKTLTYLTSSRKTSKTISMSKITASSVIRNSRRWAIQGIIVESVINLSAKNAQTTSANLPKKTTPSTDVVTSVILNFRITNSNKTSKQS